MTKIRITALGTKRPATRGFATAAKPSRLQGWASDLELYPCPTCGGMAPRKKDNTPSAHDIGGAPRTRRGVPCFPVSED